MPAFSRPILPCQKKAEKDSPLALAFTSQIEYTYMHILLIERTNIHETDYTF